jgi:hypothetical protein
MALAKERKPMTEDAANRADIGAEIAPEAPSPMVLFPLRFIVEHGS